MKTLIIGSDSFIAQQFASHINTDWKGISRTTINSENETVCADFFSIPQEHFDECNVVVNFAAIVHRPDIKDDSVYDEINYKLTILNAQKAKKSGTALFIQMSTIAVYGNVSEIDKNTPCTPISPYGISKLKADEALLQMQDDSFKVAIVRPPMVYGGGKAPGNMMRLIALASKGIPLPFKNIENKRDFIHVDNLVQYLCVIAEKRLNGVFLLSDHEPVSTEQLLQIISQKLGEKVFLVKVPKFILFLIKSIRPKEFEKLFGTLCLETNFPNESDINRRAVEHGIQEMVEWYKSSKK
jgi:UDP-glucose 4-epimerase